MINVKIEVREEGDANCCITRHYKAFIGNGYVNHQEYFYLNDIRGFITLKGIRKLTNKRAIRAFTRLHPGYRFKMA